MTARLRAVSAQPQTYQPADAIRAAGAHPNPSHAAKWLTAIKWLRRGKVSRWLIDNQVGRKA